MIRRPTDDETAVRDFRWPALLYLNWALDYFDTVAAGNENTAFHILDEDGTEHVRSFPECRSGPIKWRISS